MDLTSGHQETTETGVFHAPIASDVTEMPLTHEAALLAVSRTTYTRVMAMVSGNVSAAQLAIAEELRKAGFELEEDNEELIARSPTFLAVLADGRSVQRLGSGEWVVLRDYGQECIGEACVADRHRAIGCTQAPLGRPDYGPPHCGSL
ncbi:MAG: hypothetical protein EA424_25165 [Planctomycetaceae bacterium]|nr:MAG: hypothetical protein EA424_25165 [Planctomycetaceae bacterium]